MLHGPSNLIEKGLPHVEEHVEIQKKYMHFSIAMVTLRLVGVGIFGSRHSRMDQVKFVEGSL